MLTATPTDSTEQSKASAVTPNGRGQKTANDGPNQLHRANSEMVLQHQRCSKNTTVSTATTYPAMHEHLPSLFEESHSPTSVRRIVGFSPFCPLNKVQIHVGSYHSRHTNQLGRTTLSCAEVNLLFAIYHRYPAFGRSFGDAFRTLIYYGYDVLKWATIPRTEIARAGITDDILVILHDVSDRMHNAAEI
jgi:hypothetical protein